MANPKDSCFERLVDKIKTEKDQDKKAEEERRLIAKAWAKLKIAFSDGQPILQGSLFSVRSDQKTKIAQLTKKLLEFDQVQKECGLTDKHADDQLFRLRRFNRGNDIENQIDSLFIDLIQAMRDGDEAEVRTQLENGAKLNDLFSTGESSLSFTAPAKLLAQVYKTPLSNHYAANTQADPIEILSLLPDSSLHRVILKEMLGRDIAAPDSRKSQKEILKHTGFDDADPRREFKKLLEFGLLKKSPTGKGFYLSDLGKKVASQLG